MHATIDDPKFLRIGGMRFVTAPTKDLTTDCARCAMSCERVWKAHVGHGLPAPLRGLAHAERTTSAGDCAMNSHYYKVAQHD